jgi:tetratricopeptide (TPR) repeat protein
MKMAPKPLTMNPNYLAMVRGTRKLHQLIAAGMDDSPEADAIRDATDGPWEALSEIERNRVRNLSEDLYSLIEPPPATQPMNHQAQSKLSEAFEARQRGEWDRALELIRRLAVFLAPDMVSFFRGRTWLDAGDIETAVLFLKHASKLQPDNGNYLAIYLYALEKVDPMAGRALARQILNDPDNNSPVVVVRAADIVFDASQSLPEVKATQQFRELITVIDRALSRIEASAEVGMDSLHYGIGVLLLAFCHELLGNTQAAADSLTRGLQQDPSNPGILGTRGIVQYGISPRAVSDLELAVRNGSTELWPFYFLAHHYLLTARFEECRKFCERVLSMNSSAAVKSEVCEWMAIAEAELGFSTDMVRASFESAIRFDSSNERAKRNLAAFETAIAMKNFETRSPGAVRSSSLAERRSAMAA